MPRSHNVSIIHRDTAAICQRQVSEHDQVRTQLHSKQCGSVGRPTIGPVDGIDNSGLIQETKALKGLDSDTMFCTTILHINGLSTLQVVSLHPAGSMNPETWLDLFDC